MSRIYVIDRTSRKKEEEKIYGGWALSFVYSNNPFSKLIAYLVARIPLFSKWYGDLQKKPSSKRKVQPFIRTFGVDFSEFQDSVDSFSSFNDFFIRKLKPSARPIAKSDAILFADSRYLFYPDLSSVDGFFVKGKQFSLSKLLDSEELAAKYEQGAMVIARLCPTDYHRFHFPFDCIPSSTRNINGYLYSVSPKALKKNIEILSENKRVITELKSEIFGVAQYIEIGATCVGTIHQTFTPNQPVKKGDEKGYFSFGGSCIILLFEKDSIRFDEDLDTSNFIEIKGLFGQSLGNALQMGHSSLS